MDCEKRVFYVTTNFMPDYDREFELVKDDIYKHIATGALYRRRLLADQGWGQEPGYVRFPEPTFEELIALIEYTPKRIKRNPFYIFSKDLRELNYICYSNLWGAVSVIMQDHVPLLIDFLAQKVETDYFKDRRIRRKFRQFVFDGRLAKKFGHRIGGGVRTKPYETIFQEHEKWNAISHKVIKQVYRW